MRVPDETRDCRALQSDLLERNPPDGPCPSPERCSSGPGRVTWGRRSTDGFPEISPDRRGWPSSELLGRIAWLLSRRAGWETCALWSHPLWPGCLSFLGESHRGSKDRSLVTLLLLNLTMDSMRTWVGCHAWLQGAATSRPWARPALGTVAAGGLCTPTSAPVPSSRDTVWQYWGCTSERSFRWGVMFLPQGLCTCCSFSQSILLPPALLNRISLTREAQLMSSENSTFCKAFLKSPLSDEYPLECEHFTCPYFGDPDHDSGQQVVLSPLCVETEAQVTQLRKALSGYDLRSQCGAPLWLPAHFIFSRHIF